MLSEISKKRAILDIYVFFTLFVKKMHNKIHFVIAIIFILCKMVPSYIGNGYSNTFRNSLFNNKKQKIEKYEKIKLVPN